MPEGFTIGTLAAGVGIFSGVVSIGGTVVGTALTSMPAIIETAKGAKEFIQDDTKEAMASEAKNPKSMKKMSETAAHQAAKEKGMDPQKLIDNNPVAKLIK